MNKVIKISCNEVTYEALVLKTFEIYSNFMKDAFSWKHKCYSLEVCWINFL